MAGVAERAARAAAFLKGSFGDARCCRHLVLLSQYSKKRRSNTDIVCGVHGKSAVCPITLISSGCARAAT